MAKNCQLHSQLLTFSFFRYLCENETQKTMKKTSILFVALLAILLTVSCRGSDKQIDNQNKVAPQRQGWDNVFPLYGDVESVTMISSELSETCGEAVKKVMTEKTVCKFNQKGDVIETAYYNGSGELNWKVVYEYDSQGKIINSSDSGLQKGADCYKYDSQGRLIEEYGYKPDFSLYLKYSYRYDSQGKLIEKKEYACPGSLKEVTHYRYDSQGRLIEWDWLDSKYILDCKTHCKYDSQGNLTEWLSLIPGIPNDEILSKWVYKCDLYGNVIEGQLCDVYICGDEETLIPKSALDIEIVYRE
jgi:hypothetical protein